MMLLLSENLPREGFLKKKVGLLHPFVLFRKKVLAPALAF